MHDYGSLLRKKLTLIAICEKMKSLYQFSLLCVILVDFGMSYI